MKPYISFFIAVVLSELLQLGAWKLNNKDKPYSEWFSWGLPHLMTNIIYVGAIFVLWKEQTLDDTVNWLLSWFGLSSTIQWDQLLQVNNSVGFMLGGGADMFGDKIGRIVGLLSDKLFKKEGA